MKEDRITGPMKKAAADTLFRKKGGIISDDGQTVSLNGRSAKYPPSNVREISVGWLRGMLRTLTV